MLARPGHWQVIRERDDDRFWMSVNSTILINDVSKRFYLRREHYRSFQDIFVNLGNRRSRAEEFWALRNVSLTVSPGETVGIIGDNGSGKSTLLKLVTRIIEPTEGRVQVSGRVSALLELGAGFHPDLSGRDNVYLNWSLMGLSRKQVDAHFDEIVAFAELEQFIDTPVRLYSSGMYVRLAFAAAIAIASDVLIVDEVLAVGDVAFQEKCYSRIHEMRREGRAILIVSHSLPILQRICDRIIWLDHGQVRYDGHPDQAISHYLNLVREREEAQIEKGDSEAEQDAARTVAVAGGLTYPCEITRVKLSNEQGQEQHIFAPYEPMHVEIGYLSYGRRERPLSATVTIRRDDGLEVHRVTAASYDVTFAPDLADGVIRLRYDGLNLAPGHYTVDVALTPYDDPLRLMANREGIHHLVIQAPVELDQGVVAMCCHWGGSTVHRDGSRLSTDGAQGEVGQRSQLTWAPSQARVAEVSERFVDGQWYGPEGDEASYRWLGEQASLYLMPPSPTSRLVVRYHNSLAQWGRGATRLKIYVDDQPLGEYNANQVDLMTAVGTISLPKRKVVKITFVVDRVARPIDWGIGEDTRALGVAIQDVSLQPVVSLDHVPVTNGVPMT